MTEQEQVILDPAIKDSLQTIAVDVATTWIRIKCNRYAVTPDGISLADFIRKTLYEREWNPRIRTLSITAKYLWYNNQDGCAYFPRYALDKLEEYILPFGFKLSKNYISPIEPKDMYADVLPSVQLREVQVPIVDFLTDIDRNPKSGAFKPLSLMTGGGKGTTFNTPIKTPGGWTNIGDLRIGDKVMTVDGTYVDVTGVYPQGVEEVFRLTFDDGRWIETDSPHLWTVYYGHTKEADHYEPKKTVKNTGELFEIMHSGLKNIRVYIPIMGSEKINDVNLPLDPYLIGVLIGDGCLSSPTLTITTDKWICDKIKPILDKLTIEQRTAREYGNVNNTVTSTLKHTEKLKTILSDLQLSGKRAWEKSIPEIYLNSSHNQRLELIRGLMDTDGSATDPATKMCRNGSFNCSSGTLEYCTTSATLAEQFVYLLRSVGAKASIIERYTHYTHNGEYKTGRKSFRIRIRARHPDELFHLPRKKNRCSHWHQYSRNWRLRLVKIEKLATKKECVCISVNHPSHLYVAKDFIVTHNTICAIYSAVKIGYTTLIILQGLIEQWIDSIKKFTDIQNEDIYLIKGGASIITLWHKIKEGYRPKIIIGSTRTLANYILEPQGKYRKMPSFNKLCEAAGIGIKVIDECHLNFATNCMIDLHSNIKVNIYLSATYQRSSRDGRRIFNMAFPDKLKFGAQFIKKYTTVEMVYYHLCIPPEDLGKFKSDRGYNHAVYEKYLRKHPKYMKLYVNEVIYPLIDTFFCEKTKLNQHCLILVKTRDFAEELYSRLAKKLVNTSMAVFFSGDQGMYGLEENLHKDIIISTISSCGTGRDIKGLKTCICTVSMSSQPQSLQCLGRLREIPGEDVFYVDLCNEEIYSQRQHASLRIQYFKNRVKELTEFKIR